MFLFIETIHYKNGEMPLIHWHNQRFLSTQKTNWNTIIYPNIIDCLNIEINNFVFEKDISYKIRLVYSKDNLQIDIEKYLQKSISALYLIDGKDIDYSFKYYDRNELTNLKSKVSINDEIIIVKKNCLTDTSFTNIALSDGKHWYTPETPLLHGTQLQYLIEKKILIPKKIELQDLSNFSQIALFNAMVNWENAWKFPTTQVNPSLLHL